jgi:N-acetylglucosamine-6-phosphate deacetylase
MSASAFAITGGKTVLPGQIREDIAILCQDGVIAALLPAAELPVDMTRFDVAGCYVTPGLIDLHAHGALGHGFDETDEGVYEQLLAFFARHGITALQVSLASEPLASLHSGLRFVRDRVPALHSGSQILGVHLEGPFLAQEQRGAHNPLYLGPPSPSDVGGLLSYPGTLTMITLAPELPGGLEATRRLSDAGIVVAVGHSAAAGGQLRTAADNGARHITHLWSGQSALTRQGPWRVPGLIEDSLASDGMTAEIIADGRHLPDTLLTIARRCLGERLCLVSDASRGTGLPEGTGYTISGLACHVVDGVGVVDDADSFAGSVTTIDVMLSYLHRQLHWPLPETIAMATEVPAQVLGLTRKGRIAVGYDADLTVFDEDIHPVATVIAGRWAHRAPGTATPSTVGQA